MQVRKAFVAGRFYPAEPGQCREEINGLLAKVEIKEELPVKIDAVIVPHAGWVFSGSLAVTAFAAIKQQGQKVDTFVIFGAAHSYYGGLPAIYNVGAWQSPLGDIAIDEELAAEIANTGFAVNSREVHRNEHSIEVQVPIIQMFFPDAKILPILVPAEAASISLGDAVGDCIIAKKDKNYICVGSTDLTHYGPGYGFTPRGRGGKGIEWASDVNDAEFIGLALKLETEAMLASALKKYNACGPGAAAATIAAAKRLGKTKGVLLGQTNSNTIMKQNFGSTSDDSVGYAAIVF